MRARWAAIFVRSLGMGPEEAEVVAYGLYVLWLQGLSWVGLAALAGVAGVLGPALWAGLVAASVRAFAGGAHAGSPARCLLISVLALVGLSVAAQRVAAWHGLAAGTVTLATLAALAAGLWWVGAWAPRLAPERPRPGEARRRRLRALSLTVAGAWAALHGAVLLASGGSPPVLAGGWALAWQGFTLTRWGERLLRALDGLLAGPAGREALT